MRKDTTNQNIKKVEIDYANQVATKFVCSDKVELIDLKNCTKFVNNENVVRKVAEVFQSNFYGILVVGAPYGAGKSSYVEAAVHRLRKSVLVHATKVKISSIEDFRNTFSVPEGQDILSLIPDGSFLVFDQQDFHANEITSAMKDFIIRLAPESRNLKRFKVVVVVSDAETMDLVCSCNGGQKILPAIYASEFKWDENKMKELADSIIATDDPIKSELVNLLALSKCAGTMFDWASRVAMNHVLTQEDEQQIINEQHRKNTEWDSFHKLLSHRSPLKK